MSMYAAELELARRAARRAGAAVMKYFGTELAVQHKSPGQPLTEADLEANRLLHDDLMGAHPDYGWLSEETQDTAGRLTRERVWIVDPIDGTRSFIARRPEFALSLGLVEAGVPIVGVVYNPAHDELFYAARGSGAFVEVGGGAAQELRVSDRNMSDEVTLLASRSEIAAGELEPFRDGWYIQPAGSTAYKLACVAWCKGDAFISRGPKSEWDVCAGVLIVAEAGGRSTDLRGDAPVFNRADPYVHGIIATNGTLHDAMLRRVRAQPATERLRTREHDPLHSLREANGE